MTYNLSAASWEQFLIDENINSESLNLQIDELFFETKLFSPLSIEINGEHGEYYLLPVNYHVIHEMNCKNNNWIRKNDSNFTKSAIPIIGRMFYTRHLNN